MGVPSILLKQHIGTMEKKISKMKTLPEVKMLMQAGCYFHDGVVMVDSYTGFEYTPYSILGNLSLLKASEQVRALETFKQYTRFLSRIDPDDVRACYELNRIREDYQEQRLKESIRPGAKLFCRTDAGIILIEIDKISETKVTYRKIVNGILNDNVQTGYINRLRLFVTEEDAWASYAKERMDTPNGVNWKPQ